MSRSQYQYTITTGNNADLLNWSDRLFDAMRREPILRNVAAETQTGGLRSQVRIDRQNMGRLGVSMQNVDDILNDAFGQRQISTIYTQSNQYRVILEASEQYQRDPKALEKLYVAAPGGGPQTPLGTIVHIDSVSAPLSVSHQEQFPAATISFDLAPGASLGDALQAIARIKKIFKCRRSSSARSAATRRSSTSRSPASPISFSRRSSRFTWCWASFTRASRIPSPCSPPCPRRASAPCSP